MFNKVMFNKVMFNKVMFNKVMFKKNIGAYLIINMQHIPIIGSSVCL